MELLGQLSVAGEVSEEAFKGAWRCHRVRGAHAARQQLVQQQQHIGFHAYVLLPTPLGAFPYPPFSSLAHAHTARLSEMGQRGGDYYTAVIEGARGGWVAAAL